MVIAQRLEQRLALRQELRMHLALAQIDALDTEGGKNAQAEAQLLARIHHDLTQRVYTSVDNFVERVGKRVPKKKRTDATRQLVTLVRALLTLGGYTTLDEIKALVGFGLLVYKRWNVAPSDEYEQLKIIWESESCQTQTMRHAVADLLTTHLTSEQGANNVGTFLGSFVPRAGVTAELLEVLIQKLRTADERTVSAYDESLTQVLPERAITRTQFEQALGLIDHYERLLGFLNIGPPRERFKMFIAERCGEPTILELPPLVQCYLPKELAQELSTKLAGWWKTEPLASSIDAVREVLRALRVLERTPEQLDRTVTHLITVVPTGKMFVRICREIGKSAYFPGQRFDYPLDAKTADELLTLVASTSETKALNKLPLQAGYKERLIELLDREPLLTQIILRLVEIYDKQHTEVLGVLARITEALIDRVFATWRYTHDAADAQLKPVQKALAVWRENMTETRVLGQMDRVTASIAAVKLLQNEAATIFERRFQKPWTKQLGGELELTVFEATETLRNCTGDAARREEAIQQVSRVRQEYQAARLIELFECEAREVDMVDRHFAETAKKPWAAPWQDLLTRARSILAAPEVREMRIVRVVETDAPIDLFQVGAIPTLSCQRWMEPTSYNQCLLAYVADANKKLWQLRSPRGDVLGRCVVRLFSFKKSALLLIEPPYANQWSEDHQRALLAAILRKAAALSKALGKTVAVGYIGTKRWGEWAAAFNAVGKELGFEPTTTNNFKPTLADSYNFFEYSDCLGGCLPRGHVFPHVMRLTYIGVGEGEDNLGDDDY